MPALERAVRGAAAGWAGAVAMSGVLLVSNRVGVTPKVEPEAITEAGLDAVDVDRSERDENALATVAHLGYGALMGAVYGVLRPHLRAPGWLSGPGFGVLVAVASYEGWVPAAGILPRLRHQDSQRRWQLLVAHGVYGAVLGRLAGSAPD